MLFTPTNEIHHHQKVAGEAHLGDRLQLEIQSFPIPLAFVLVIEFELLKSAIQAFVGYLCQKRINGHTLGHGKIREKRLAQRNTDTASPGYLDRVGQRLGNVLEQRRHLSGGSQILLLRVQAGASGIIEGSAITDTNSRLMSLIFLCIEKADIVGGNDRTIQGRCKRDDTVDIVFLLRASGAMQLQIISVGE